MKKMISRKSTSIMLVRLIAGSSSSLEVLRGIRVDL
jgi:hypothetical protein